MKRILLLSDVNSAHTKKWVSILLEKDVELAIYSLSLPEKDWYTAKGVALLSSSGFKEDKFGSSEVSKISYLNKRKELQRVISRFRPSVVHAHYASSYGLLGALSGFHPLYTSVWGSDILLFPSNPIKRFIVKYNLKKADKVIVSSNVLYDKALKLGVEKPIQIPFGVDSNLFTYVKREPKDKITIGIVKSLEAVYGIDTLISAMQILRDKGDGVDYELHIIGKGSLENNLKEYARVLKVDKQVRFFSPVSQEELVSYYHQMDIAIFLSHSESFGVAVLEAQSTGLPIVVSKVGGLMQVTEENVTALWVEPSDAFGAAVALSKLATNSVLRNEMGLAGRQKVEKEYELTETKSKIWSLYRL